MRLLSLTLYKRTQHLIKNDAVTMDESDFPAFFFSIIHELAWQAREGWRSIVLHCIDTFVLALSSLGACARFVMLLYFTSTLIALRGSEWVEWSGILNI